MVLIEIRGDAWEVYKRSWALMGIRSHEELVRILEDDIEEKSISVIEDAERQLIDDEPEAYVRREIGILKEKKDKKNKHKSAASMKW
jgi:hypothetical protein